MVHTFTQYLHWYTKGLGENKWTVLGWKVEDSADFIFVKEFPGSVEVPEDFNPIPAQVAAIRKEIDEAKEEMHRTVAGCEQRISELLCLENNPTAPPTKEDDNVPF